MSSQNNIELPEGGDLVLATVRQVTSHGAYVDLEEYQGSMGFLHVSELSTGWVRHIDRYVRVNQKIVLKVIRVNNVRKEVDLSLRQVTQDERKKKLIEVKRDDKANGIMELVKEKLGLDEATSAKYVDVLWDNFDDLYAALEDTTRKGTKALQKLDLPENYVSMIAKISQEKIVVRSVEVGGTLELTCPGSDGVSV
ncbi:MAG: S1 RNA-binding domain-containing protein, partial [Nitrososphaerales archaeon]